MANLPSAIYQRLAHWRIRYSNRNAQRQQSERTISSAQINLNIIQNLYLKILKLALIMDSEDSYQLNLQESKKIGEMPVYKQYKQWLKANGVIVDPALLYPAYFGKSKSGTVGVATTKLIPNSHAIIAVPYDLIITVQKVKDDPQLLKIIQENPNVFRYNEQSAFSILTLFVCRQLSKGKKSFYSPYFAIADNISLVNWTHWDMLGLQNVDLMKLMKSQLEDIESHFMKFLSIFRRYPNVFPEAYSNAEYKQLFEKSYNFICTRAFGWSLPSISLIPMADSLNHNNQYVDHMLIDIKLEKQPHQMYSPKHKKYNLSLLSQMYPELPKSQGVQRKKHRKDKFIEKHKQILQQGNKKDSQAYILWQQYKAGVRNFRQLHFYDESCEQDNDTDEETIENLQFSLEKLRFYQKYETKGINDKNKAIELTKYWKIFLDPIFGQDQSQQQEEQQKDKDSNQIKETKKKFLEESKQSQGSSLVSSSSSSDSDDEQFKWMAGNPDSHNHKTTYFIMASRKPIKKDEQIYNFYGRRSNRFLLIGYNFVLDNNKYDSFAFRINIDNWQKSNKPFETKLPVPKLINKEGKTNVYFTKQIRVKSQKVCIELINHCRALLIGWSQLKTQQNRKVKITIPFSIQFEKKVLSLSSQFIKTLLKQYMTSLEEDQQLLQKAQKHETKCAIKMRMSHKSILESQLDLLERCQQILKSWKNGKISVGSENEMRNLGQIRHYVCSLQRGKL